MHQELAIIIHEKYGKLEYVKVYFTIEEPVLFVCTFEKDANHYIGMMVGEGGHENVTWKNYYFCGALENEITAAETKPGFLKKLFENRPVMYLHRTNEDGFIRNMWKTYSAIDPSYQISAEATLS